MQDESVTLALVATLADQLKTRAQTLATAESCTGGLLAGALTELPGSSAWFDRGWITYSNQAKSQELNVPAALIDTHGAVSEAVAYAMAEGARSESGANYAVSVTGIAGPDGGSPDKPVGTVCFGWSTPTQTKTATRYFQGDRQQIRIQSVRYALTALTALLADDSL